MKKKPTLPTVTTNNATDINTVIKAADLVSAVEINEETRRKILQTDMGEEDLCIRFNLEIVSAKALEAKISGSIPFPLILDGTGEGNMSEFIIMFNDSLRNGIITPLHKKFMKLITEHIKFKEEDHTEPELLNISPNRLLSDE